MTDFLNGSGPSPEEIKRKMAAMNQAEQMQQIMNFFSINFLALNSKLDLLTNSHEKLFNHIIRSCLRQAYQEFGIEKEVTQEQVKDILHNAINTFNASKNKS